MSCNRLAARGSGEHARALAALQALGSHSAQLTCMKPHRIPAGVQAEGEAPAVRAPACAGGAQGRRRGGCEAGRRRGRRQGGGTAPRPAHAALPAARAGTTSSSFLPSFWCVACMFQRRGDFAALEGGQRTLRCRLRKQARLSGDAPALCALDKRNLVNILKAERVRRLSVYGHQAGHWTHGILATSFTVFNISFYMHSRNLVQEQCKCKASMHWRSTQHVLWPWRTGGRAPGGCAWPAAGGRQAGEQAAAGGGGRRTRPRRSRRFSLAPSAEHSVW